MSTGDARHGRRDNGLVAAEYAAVGDVDPRVGEHLLDVLGLDGIAAYLRPSIDLNPITRSSSLPKRPTDRLYVDRAHIATARDYVRRLAEEGEAAPPTPGAPPLNADEVEAAWAEIVAGYDRTADVFRPDPTSAPAPIDPTRETTRPEPRDRTEPRERAEPGDRTEPRGRPDWIRLPPPGAGSRKDDAEESSLLDGLDTFAAGLDDDEEGYTPPKAPPIPRPSMPSVLAVIGIVGGLLVFLQPTLMPMSERSAMLLGFTAVVSGFATLVWRLRPGDDEDDDGPDDGARV